MASDANKRQAFATDCFTVMKKYELDGIDIDWEYPTSSQAGIVSSPDDTNNYTLLMKDIRAAIGPSPQSLLTLASCSTGKFINFPDILPFVDFICVMAYDMGLKHKYHHCSLYKSKQYYGGATVDESIKAHLSVGIPPQKLVLGVPFYGRGDKEVVSDFKDYKDIIKLISKDSSEKGKYNLKRKWDEEAKCPYLVLCENDDNSVSSSALTQERHVCSYDDVESLVIKCEYVHKHDLLGVMYWEYSCDDEVGTLRKTVLGGVLNIYDV